MVPSWFVSGTSHYSRPYCIWIYYIAYNQGLLSLQNKYIQALIRWTLICGVILFVVQAHPLTIAYGMRTSLLHFPLIFVMGRVLSWEDVISFGKAFLILALPMTWVVAQQFQADRFDIMNVASGGTGHQMMTSGDKVRASGTFHFISGIVFYYCFCNRIVYLRIFTKREFFRNGCYTLALGLLFGNGYCGESFSYSRIITSFCMLRISCLL